MSEPTLFDADPFRVEVPAPEPVERLSADRRRTQRQAETIARGGHPLQLIGPGIKVHPDAAGRTATKENGKDRPLRCGTCVFRQEWSGGQHHYTKCMWRPSWDEPNEKGFYRASPPRATHAPASDVRGWWPACTDFQPRETGQVPADGTATGGPETPEPHQVDSRSSKQ